MSERIVGQIWKYPALGNNGYNYYLVLAYHGADSHGWHSYTLYDYKRKKEIHYENSGALEEVSSWEEA